MSKQYSAYLAGMLFNDMFNATLHEDVTWEEAVFAAALAIKALTMKQISAGDDPLTAEQTKLKAIDQIARALEAHVHMHEVESDDDIGGRVTSEPTQ